MATSADKRTKSKAKKNSRRSRGAGSFLLSRTSRLSARITWSFRQGLISKVFCTADRVEDSLHGGLATTVSETAGLRDLVVTPVKKAVAVGASRSVLFARGDGLRRAFLHTKARFFGIALLVFALYSAGIFLAKEYVGLGLGAASPMDLYTAVASLPVSIFLLFCGCGTLCTAYVTDFALDGCAIGVGDVCHFFNTGAVVFVGVGRAIVHD